MTSNGDATFEELLKEICQDRSDLEDRYWNTFNLFWFRNKQNVALCNQIIERLCAHIGSLHIDRVIGVSVRGIPFAALAAYFCEAGRVRLSTIESFPFLFLSSTAATKPPIRKSERVLVVDDLVHSGQTAYSIITALQKSCREVYFAAIANLNNPEKAVDDALFFKSTLSSREPVSRMTAFSAYDVKDLSKNAYSLEEIEPVALSDCLAPSEKGVPYEQIVAMGCTSRELEGTAYATWAGWKLYESRDVLSTILEAIPRSIVCDCVVVSSRWTLPIATILAFLSKVPLLYVRTPFYQPRGKFIGRDIVLPSEEVVKGAGLKQPLLITAFMKTGTSTQQVVNVLEGIAENLEEIHIFPLIDLFRGNLRSEHARIERHPPLLGTAQLKAYGRSLLDPQEA